MSNIRKHMAVLVPGIASAASERERLVGDIKLQTANMLRAFSRERRAMVKSLKSELVADRVSRSAEVLAILDNANEMSNGFRQDHGIMRHALLQSLVESKQAVGTSVASLFNEFSKERADFSKAHRCMAKAQCAGLAKDRRDRSHAVAELMRSFTKAHRHMAQVQWADLAKCRRDRSYSLAELMHGFHGSHGYVVRQFAKSLPSSNWTAPLPVKPSVLIKPAAPIAAARSEPVKPLPKVAQSFTKPWPSTSPRGEPVNPVAKKAKAKATPVKTVPPKAKALKPKKK